MVLAHRWTVLEDAVRGDDMESSLYLPPEDGAAEEEVLQWKLRTAGTTVIATFDVHPEVVRVVAQSCVAPQIVEYTYLRAKSRREQRAYIRAHTDRSPPPPSPPPPELLHERTFIHEAAARQEILISQQRDQVTISMRQDEVKGTGGIVWDVSEALARWLHATYLTSGSDLAAAVEVRAMVL